MWRRLGSEVQVVEFTERIAAGADHEIAYAILAYVAFIPLHSVWLSSQICFTSAEFKKLLEKQGIKFRMGAKVTSATKQSNGNITLSVEPAKGGAAEKIEADCVLVSVGRKPYIEKLGVKVEPPLLLSIECNTYCDIIQEMLTPFAHRRPA